MGVRGPGLDSAQRPDVDDAAVDGAQVRESLAGNEEGTAGVGLEDLVPGGDGELVERGRIEDGGVVDDEVEPAVEGCRGGDGRANGVLGADIAREGLRTAAEGFEFADRGGGLVCRIAIGDGDAEAGFTKGERNGTAKTASTAGDERRACL